MRITLLCNAGITTGIMVAQIRQYVDQTDTVMAYEYSNIQEAAENSDVVLLGPQAKFHFGEAKEICGGKGVPCGVINVETYKALDGQAIANQAKELLAQSQRETDSVCAGQGSDK